MYRIMLFLMTLAACVAGYIFTLLFGMLIVGAEAFWLNALPIAIIVLNIFSGHLYSNVLSGFWRYLYNMLLSAFVITVCFYGSVKWTPGSMHYLNESMKFSILTIIVILATAAGIAGCIILSKKRRLKQGRKIDYV